MGILKNFEGDIHDNENVNSVAQIDPLLHPHHFDSSSSSSEDEEVHDNPIAPAPAAVAAIVPAVITTRTPKVKKPVSKMPKPILHVKNIGGKQSQGNRQTRRHENMCFLLNLARDLDEDFAEININDLVETTISAFAQLLLNKNKMKVWHEFVELPERQQERIVKLATDKNNKKGKSKRDTTISNSCSSDDTDESFVLVENRTTTKDNQCERLGHLQEEATTCYRRIDPNIRSTFKSMLKRHHLPFDRISWFEDDVIPFFKENPDSVYLRDLNNSFDRMLLHAVCQYLNLISKSFTRDGERYTQVENRRFEFVPPIILLSEYVKSMQVNPNGLVNDIFSNHANKTVS